jgi:hypothetical protein
MLEQYALDWGFRRILRHVLGKAVKKNEKVGSG